METCCCCRKGSKKTQSIATKYHLEFCSFSLLNRDEIQNHLKGFKAVLNCAGPFIETIHPLVDVCIDLGVHYLDVTGEADVFLRLLKLSSKAEQSKCMLLPGVGFDVVPSDCIAHYAQSLLPDATHLDIAIKGLGSASKNLNTALKSLVKSTLVRRDSELVFKSQPLRKMICFDNDPEACMAVSWGDVVTAYHSTKIPNITVYFKEFPSLVMASKIPYIAKLILSSSWVRKVIYRSKRSKPGPSQKSSKTVQQPSLRQFGMKINLKA